jgi:CheY-specific phosphatase CheX
MIKEATQTVSQNVTFEEIMFTIISATQEVFREIMNIQLLAGNVEKRMPTVSMDLVSIVGISGSRVGYIMIGSDKRSASLITKRMLMVDMVDAHSIRDAFGELANNVAGVFRTKYHDQYGVIAMGLPLVVSGRIHPMGSHSLPKVKHIPTMIRMQQQGVVIPFQTADGMIKVNVMFYM